MTADEHPTPLHPAAAMFAQECRAGLLSRREFLTRATALGISAITAHALIGGARPVAAQGATPATGGTLRMAMDLRPTGDPRTWAWSESANFCRGWLDYLVEYETDGSIRGMLLERWEANADATVWTLHLRQGVKWNNGDDFTSADVLHNLQRWCDGSADGNSMASRLDVLRDPATGQLRAGAVEVLDDHTLILHASSPDIALIVNMADYPAAITHRSYDGGDPAADPLGTGPYVPVVNDADALQVLERHPTHIWWGSVVYGGPYLDRLEYIDLGADPLSVLAAARADRIDANYQTTGEFLDAYDALGWQRSETATASTIAVRFNQRVAPYDNRDLRRAVMLAVDNAVVLELGYSDLGTVAENHHVSPLHPEYAPGIFVPPDPEAARALLAETGHGDFGFELVSVDDGWQSRTCDAVAAQMRDAGMQVTRTVLPIAHFVADWMRHPFSATEWNMRPLGVQVLNLAYKSGAAWNETGFANAEFDTLLAEANAIADADARRGVMARLQRILLDEAVVFQPYWRTLFRHARPGVHGVEKHPMLEHHHYKWWIEG